MHGIRCGDMLAKLVTKLNEVNPFIKMLTRTKHHWRNGDMHLVNQPLPQILLDHIDPTQNTNILCTRSFAGTFQCHMNAFRNKMESRSAFHRNGGSRVMGKYKYWSVIGRIIPPPSFPIIIGPRTATQCEHVSPENPCADIGKAAYRKIIIHPFLPSLFPIHFTKGGSLDHPVV